MSYINKESYSIFHQFLFQNLCFRLKIRCKLLAEVRNYNNKCKTASLLVLVELSTRTRLCPGNFKLSSSDGILSVSKFQGGL